MTQKNLVHIVCLETPGNETIPLVAFRDENRADAEAERLNWNQGLVSPQAWRDWHRVHSVRLNP